MFIRALAGTQVKRIGKRQISGMGGVSIDIRDLRPESNVLQDQQGEVEAITGTGLDEQATKVDLDSADRKI